MYKSEYEQTRMPLERETYPIGFRFIHPLVTQNSFLNSVLLNQIQLHYIPFRETEAGVDWFTQWRGVKNHPRASDRF